MNLRQVAARIINDVTDGRSLTDCLQEALPRLSDHRDRAFVQAICYGVCRYYACLDVILSYLLKNPMNAKDSDVHALLLVGLYQLKYMRIPSHAAVSETVDATAKFKKPWSRGFVNAILREYLREEAALEEKIKTEIEAVYAHPRWWIDFIKMAWPNNWEAILTENNAHPPLTLRVNIGKISREDYIALLDQGKIIPELKSGITLDKPVPVEDLPGFSEGKVFVQDGAAQLAAELLELVPGQRVLDACAAPGGKLTHILELEPELAACIAIEKDKQRIQPIKENLARLQLNAECVCADAADTGQWWDGKLFDRILLDAPCSASGVIRRHPDIKLLREPNDIKAFADMQLHLLEALWPTLKSKGLLVYATCSIFPEENTKVLESFLARHADALEKPIQATWGIAAAVGRQILPGMQGMDGFYYAVLVKN